MELKLNVYTTKFCKEIERIATAEDFELSTGICEDGLNIVNIDMFEGGLTSLSDESIYDIVISVVKNGFPFFIELVKEIFDLKDDETKRLKLSEIAVVVVDIVKYSVSQLAGTFGNKKRKN